MTARTLESPPGGVLTKAGGRASESGLSPLWARRGALLGMLSSDVNATVSQDLLSIAVDNG